MKYLLLILLLVACDDHSRKEAKDDGIIEIPIITDPPPRKPRRGPHNRRVKDFEGTGSGGQAPVPEPGTLIILGGGLGMLAASRRRSRNHVR